MKFVLILFLCIFTFANVLAQTDKPWLGIGSNHWEDYDPSFFSTTRIGNVGIGSVNYTSILRPLHIKRGYFPVGQNTSILFGDDRPAIRLESFVEMDDPSATVWENTANASNNMRGAYAWDFINEMHGLHFRFRESTMQTGHSDEWYTRFSIIHPVHSGQVPQPRFGFNNENPSSFFSLDESLSDTKFSILDDIGGQFSKFSLGAQDQTFLFNVKNQSDKFRFQALDDPSLALMELGWESGFNLNVDQHIGGNQTVDGSVRIQGNNLNFSQGKDFNISIDNNPPNEMSGQAGGTLKIKAGNANDGQAVAGTMIKGGDIELTAGKGTNANNNGNIILTPGNNTTSSYGEVKVAATGGNVTLGNASSTTQVPGAIKPKQIFYNQTGLTDIAGKVLSTTSNTGLVQWTAATDLLYPLTWEDKIVKVDADGKLVQTDALDNDNEFSVASNLQGEIGKLSFGKLNKTLNIYAEAISSYQPKVNFEKDGKNWSLSSQTTTNPDRSEFLVKYENASLSRDIIKYYGNPAQNWSGKTVEVNGSVSSHAAIFDREQIVNDNGANVSVQDLWKVYSSGDSKKMSIDFNSTSSVDNRSNRELGYYQYYDPSGKNIGYVSNFAVKMPSLVIDGWEEGLLNADQLTFGNPGAGGNLGTEALRTMTLFSANYKNQNDNIAARIHGKLLVDGIVKTDPSAPSSLSKVGELLLTEFDYKDGNAPVNTPHKTLLARERRAVSNKSELYRLVLGENIPKLGTGWSSTIDQGSAQESSPNIKYLTRTNSATPTPSLEDNYLLSVDGLAVFKSVLVMNAQAFRTWGDYVFDQPHPLSQLDTLEQYVDKNKHLPGIPSAKEIQDEGLDMAKIITEHNIKIEEIYLYLIELKKENANLRKELTTLKNEK